MQPSIPTDSPPSAPLGFLEERRGPVRYLQALREHWLFVALIVIVGTGAAAAFSLTATKRYEAEADVLVTPVSTGDETFVGFSLLREGIEEARSVVTAARIVTTPDVVERADEELEMEGSDEFIEVQPLGQSNVVNIKATASDPDRAAEIANAYADALIDERTDLFQDELNTRIDRLSDRLAVLPDPNRNLAALEVQQRLAELNSLVGAADPTVRLLSRAEAPDVPSWPRPVLSIAVAFLASILLAAGAAVALELSNTRIKREDELVLVHRLPILARIPRMRPRVLRRYLTGQGPLPPAAQKAYRVLRANLATVGNEMRLPRSILVTSAAPGEGKTLTAVNLAITMASAGNRVVLVDGDLHRPMVATIMGVAGPRDGFAKLLKDDRPTPPRNASARPRRSAAAAALVPAPGYGNSLRLALSSPEQAFLSRSLDSDAVRRVVSMLEEHADVIVIDSPPLPEVAEAMAFADVAEAVLIAVRLGHTPRDRLSELRHMLALRRVSPLGFVVTTRERHGNFPDDYYGEAEPAHARFGRPASSNGRARRSGAASPRQRTG